MSTNNNEMSSGSIFKIVVDFLEQDDWQFEILEEGETITISGGLNDGNYTGSYEGVIWIVDKVKACTFSTLCPVRVPEKKRLSIAEFLTRANYSMSIGNFEMDFQDGEIRYKNSSYLVGMKLSFETIEFLLISSISKMDRYFPGIMKVIYSDVSPEDAIAEIENSSE